jgi:hypothetical protein
MIDFLASHPLDLHQVQTIVRGMHRVAQADGQHQTELVLMREFYEACRGDAGGLADFQDVVSVGFDAEQAREALATDALRETFLKSCFLVGFADGRLSAGERKAVLEMAAAAGIPAADAARAEEMVKEHLLQQLSRLENLDALKQVQHELDEQ